MAEYQFFEKDYHQNENRKLKQQPINTLFENWRTPGNPRTLTLVTQCLMCSINVSGWRKETSKEHEGNSRSCGLGQHGKAGEMLGPRDLWTRRAQSGTLPPGTFREELGAELVWAQDVRSRKGDLIISKVGKRVGLRSCHWNCSRNWVCPALQLGPVSKTESRKTGPVCRQGGSEITSTHGPQLTNSRTNHTCRPWKQNSCLFYSKVSLLGRADDCHLG